MYKDSEERVTEYFRLKEISWKKSILTSKFLNCVKIHLKKTTSICPKIQFNVYKKCEERVQSPA